MSTGIAPPHVCYANVTTVGTCSVCGMAVPHAPPMTEVFIPSIIDAVPKYLYEAEREKVRKLRDACFEISKLSTTTGWAKGALGRIAREALAATEDKHE